MISAIKSRDFGFGYVLSAEQLAKVNEFRRTQRQEYSDTDAAMKVLGTCLKKDLERSPFVIMFDYGNSAEGYWTYDRMVLQLEDCIDVLDALHSSPYTEGNAAQRHMTLVPDTQDKLVRDYDYAFGFDWSNGHDRKKPDGLDIKGMTSKPSAKARHMRESKIDSEECLGTTHNHELKLKVNETQKMQFEDKNHRGEEERGPEQWTEEQRKIRRNVVDGTKQVDKIKDDFIADLASRNIMTKGTLPQLKERSAAAGIPLTKTVDNVVQEGFIGMAKGMYQILFERGFIDPAVKYTIDGIKDEHGQIIKETSLKYLMQQLPDFENEKTLLHYHGEKLGCIIYNSPKCTPEVAGEGIEYDWGVSKIWYRIQDTELKRNKTKFKELVLKAIGDEVLSLRMVRDNARRAREHMISYYKLEKNGESSLPSDVQKMMKTRKTHSSVIDMDKGFVSHQLRRMAAAVVAIAAIAAVAF